MTDADRLEQQLAAAREGTAALLARVVVLEERLRHRDSQVKWLRISRDNWKFRCQEARKVLRK